MQELLNNDMISEYINIEELRKALIEYKDLKIEVGILRDYKEKFHGKEREVAELKVALNKKANDVVKLLEELNKKDTEIEELNDKIESLKCALNEMD